MVESQTILANERKCAICYESFTDLTKAEFVWHANSCWAHRRGDNIFRAGREPERRRLQPADRPMPIRSSLISVIILDNDDRYTPPDLPAGFCLLCQTSLTALDAVAACIHRLNCVARYRPYRCPRCGTSFRDPKYLNVEQIVTHMYQCQNGVDPKDFVGLQDACVARRLVLQPASCLNVDRSGGSAGQRSKDYMKKHYGC